jgi:amino acid transporter
VSIGVGVLKRANGISAIARQAGARVVIDGAQSVQHIRVDVQDRGCDFYVFSGHKMLGPMATGVAWGRLELLDAMPAYHVGSNMAHEVDFERASLEHGALKFQAGTPDVAGPVGLAASTAPAADAMRQVLGPVGSTLISAGIAISTFGFLNLVVLVTPRVFQAMAADGVFFPRLARLHPVHRTPAAAIGLQAVWASALALSGSFSQLVDYVAFADWVFFGLTVAGLFVYRARDRAQGLVAPPGAFRVPGYPWTPAAFVAAAIFVVVSSILATPRNALVGTGLLALGVPVFWYWSRAGRRPV